jgi:hypothetical protein
MLARASHVLAKVARNKGDAGTGANTDDAWETYRAALAISGEERSEAAGLKALSSCGCEVGVALGEFEESLSATAQGAVAKARELLETDPGGALEAARDAVRAEAALAFMHDHPAATYRPLQPIGFGERVPEDPVFALKRTAAADPVALELQAKADAAQEKAKSLLATDPAGARDAIMEAVKAEVARAERLGHAPPTYRYRPLPRIMGSGFVPESPLMPLKREALAELALEGLFGSED